MFLPLPPLCLKDELSVTFSQSFLLINLGKVNGSVHAHLSVPLRIPLSHGISAWQGAAVCVETGHCEVCDSYAPCQRTHDFFKSCPIVPRSLSHFLLSLHVSRARDATSEWFDNACACGPRCPCLITTVCGRSESGVTCVRAGWGQLGSVSLGPHKLTGSSLVSRLQSLS